MIKFDYKAIGAKIKQERKAQAWTITELANRCHINREQVSRIENATIESRSKMINAICAALGFYITIDFVQITKVDEAPEDPQTPPEEDEIIV